MQAYTPTFKLLKITSLTNSCAICYLLLSIILLSATKPVRLCEQRVTSTWYVVRLVVRDTVVSRSLICSSQYSSPTPFSPPPDEFPPIGCNPFLEPQSTCGRSADTTCQRRRSSLKSIGRRRVPKRGTSPPHIRERRPTRDHTPDGVSFPVSDRSGRARTAFDSTSTNRMNYLITSSSNGDTIVRSAPILNRRPRSILSNASRISMQMEIVSGYECTSSGFTARGNLIIRRSV